MPFSRSVGIDFCRRPQFSIPFEEIIYAWVAHDLHPRKCRRALEKIMKRERISERYFNLDQFQKGGLIATKDLLYPVLGPWILQFILYRGQRRIDAQAFSVPDKNVCKMGAVLRLVSDDSNKDVLQSALRSLKKSILTDLFTVGSNKKWPQPQKPGIYRREHASLVIRSRKVSILLDPIRMISNELPHISGAPIDSKTAFDAIVISHSHADHWHFPSILSHIKDANAPVIVPHVIKENLLTFERFDRPLRELGQKVISAKWNSCIRIGDVEIDVLPFYGEQPTRDLPWPDPLIRSYGNCYRFNTPDFSAIVLIDSGADPYGSMLEVAKQSLKQRGPVDVILSSSREFPCPFFGGTPNYWTPLLFSQLTALHRMRKRGTLPAVTAGLTLTTQICKAAEARYYLPFANGFKDIGRPITDIGWGMGEPSEENTVQALNALMKFYAVKTLPMAWNCGDTALFNSGKMRLMRYDS